MKTSLIHEQLVRDEGLRLFAYSDSLGYTTIGVGRCIDRRKGEGITKDEALMLLDNDVVRLKSEIVEHLPWAENLSSARFGVLLNMAFNMGIDGVLAFHQMLSHMQSGDWQSASQDMLHSRWAQQVGSRSTRLSQQMVSDQWQ